MANQMMNSGSSGSNNLTKVKKTSTFGPIGHSYNYNTVTFSFSDIKNYSQLTENNFTIGVEQTDTDCYIVSIDQGSISYNASTGTVTGKIRTMRHEYGSSPKFTGFCTCVY